MAPPTYIPGRAPGIFGTTKVVWSGCSVRPPGATSTESPPANAATLVDSAGLMTSVPGSNRCTTPTVAAALEPCITGNVATMTSSSGMPGVSPSSIFRNVPRVPSNSSAVPVRFEMSHVSHASSPSNRSSSGRNSASRPDPPSAMSQTYFSPVRSSTTTSMPCGSNASPVRPIESGSWCAITLAVRSV